MEHTSWPCCISYFKLTLEKSARLWSPARPPQMKSESRSRMRGQIRSKLRRNITEKIAALAPDERFQLHKKALNTRYRDANDYIFGTFRHCANLESPESDVLLFTTHDFIFTFLQSTAMFKCIRVISYHFSKRCHLTFQLQVNELTFRWWWHGEMSDRFPAVVVREKTDIFDQTSAVFVTTELSKLKHDVFLTTAGFVPKPNRTMSTALSQHTIENWIWRNVNIATCWNVKFKHIRWLQKCALPTGGWVGILVPLRLEKKKYKYKKYSRTQDQTKTNVSSVIQFHVKK